jgi:geranylgeranyl reductase family protein
VTTAAGVLSQRADVVVVGGGPSGAVAALQLARAGARVTLLEKETLPRTKVCGDALIPDSLAVLSSLGLFEKVSADARRARGIRIYAPNGQPVDVEGTCLCLPRARLDEILVRAAVEAGATLVTGAEAVGYESGAGHARVVYRRDRGEETITTRLVVLATGASAKVLARFGVPHRSEPSALALRGYYRLRPEVPEDLLHIWYERPVLPGYAWIFPVGDHVFNVGAGIFRGPGRAPPNLREVFERFRRECVRAGEMLDGATPLEPLRGAPLRTNLEGAELVADRLLVTGEAIGSTFSLSGEGIGKAMETALLAAATAEEALASGRFGARDLSGYPEAVASRLRSKFSHYVAAQRWLRFPAVVNLVARQAARSRVLGRLLSDILNERRDPTELLSLRGFARAAFAR